MAAIRCQSKQVEVIAGLGAFGGRWNRVRIGPVYGASTRPFRGRASVQRSELFWKGRVLSTPEHFLAAQLFFPKLELKAVYGNEFPLLDGSALPWLLKMKKMSTLSKPKEVSTGLSKVWEWEGGYLKIEPANAFSAKVAHLGEVVEWKSVENPVNFLKCRTFIEESHLRELRTKNLFPGITPRMGVVHDGEGKVILGGRRCANEFAGHKLLDLIGDLALLKSLPKARITAENSGHFWNHQLVQALHNELFS